MSDANKRISSSYNTMVTCDLRSDLTPDLHSYSNPHQARVQHLDLDLEVLFDQRVLKGTALLGIERRSNGIEYPLILDTFGLEVGRVESSVDGSNYVDAPFSLGPCDPVLGAPLVIQLSERANLVRVAYCTHPDAPGLQWLEPQQTAGKKLPFVYTQSQAIRARSWVPLQDSPQVRLTYTAWLHTPKNVRAVMSADNSPHESRDGNYIVRMDQPIPSYLIAMAVGDLLFRPLGNRTGVYAEAPVIERAAREFEDTERMMAVAEKLYGPYLWERYDMLVLPPSFPLGGMENPRLTFLTPTMLTGDKSFVSLVAHELAHSWSGNLVTNATWRDFWLNEGFSVYVERRILEEIYGREREEMEAMLGRQDLEQNLATLEERDEIMHVDLAGRDPDAGVTRVPYEKGALFLRYLEEAVGRSQFDQFMRGYFDHFAFQSITTQDFVSYLRENLLDQHPQLTPQDLIDEWIYEAGIPIGAPQPKSDAFEKVEKQTDQWVGGAISLSDMPTASWTTHEWLHFLRYLPKKLDRKRLEELDEAFSLTESPNAEIAHQWLLITIRNSYRPAYRRLSEFLLSTGRRKLIKPLYEELIKTSEGKERAKTIYAEARYFYHPIVVATIDELMLKAPEAAKKTKLP